MLGVKGCQTLPSGEGRVVLVEGNIGVGKTTLVTDLGKQLGYRVFLEPTAKNPYLAKFYENPKKYALKLQLWIFRQRFLIYVDAIKHFLETGQGVLLDRSVFSDRVFADVGREDRNISEQGYEQYSCLRKLCLSRVPIPHAVIHLDASPSVCHSRIHSRGRECESGIPISYLESLHRSYQNFFIDMQKLGTKVLSFNWANFGSTLKVVSDVKSLSNAQLWNALDLSAVNTFVHDGQQIDNVLALSKDGMGVEEKDSHQTNGDLQLAEEHCHSQERRQIETRQPQSRVASLAKAAVA